MTPHPCTILAVDPGKVSGWSHFHHGHNAGSGVARTHEERRVAVASAVEIALGERVPLVVVAEKWTPGGRFAGARTMAGLGAQWGLWLAALEAVGGWLSVRGRNQFNEAKLRAEFCDAYRRAA